MDRLKHGRKFLFRVEICRWRNANGSDYGWTEIGEDVPKKIGAYHHVKPIGMTHKMRGENVDMKLIGANVRIFARERTEAIVPKRHGVNDAVRFGSGRKMFFTLAGQFERETQHAVHAAAREYRLLNGHLIFSAFIQTPANVGIFPFVVFANDGEIDLAWFPIFQRRFDAFEKAHRTKIRILAERAADGDQ